MLDFVVISMVLNNKKKQEQYKTQKITELKMKQSKNKNSCEHCGQYLPWFCVCYLNSKKKSK